MNKKTHAATSLYPNTLYVVTFHCSTTLNPKMLPTRLYHIILTDYLIKS